MPANVLPTRRARGTGIHQQIWRTEVAREIAAVWESANGFVHNARTPRFPNPSNSSEFQTISQQ